MRRVRAAHVDLPGRGREPPREYLKEAERGQKRAARERDRRDRGVPDRRGRELRRTGFISGRSRALPSIRSLRAASCPGNISGFRAELVMVAEFARMHAYRGVWTHPMCRDFPKEYIDAIWSFVESETEGAVHRFNRDQCGPLPPGAQPECHTNYNTCCVGCPPPDEG